MQIIDEFEYKTEIEMKIGNFRKLTAEEYRDAPILYSMLDVDSKRAILEEVTGSEESFAYVPQDWPESRFKNIQMPIGTHSEPFRTEVGAVLSAINLEVSIHSWRRVARLLMFFRVEHWRFGTSLEMKMFDTFTKVFPLGCFHSKVALSNLNCRPDNTDQWVFGCPCEYVITRSLFYSDALFEQICFYIEKSSYTMIQIRCIVYEFIQCRSDGTEDRINMVIKLLSQKRLSSIEEPYATLGFLNLESSSASFVSLAKTFTRPIWSRKRDRSLAFGDLLKEVKTIILMQKFRYSEFPLHQDLIDKVAGYLFDAFYERLVKYFNRRRAFAKERQNFEAATQYCRSAGIVLGDYSFAKHYSFSPKLSHAYDLHHGMAIDRHNIDMYDQEMVHEITSWPGVYGVCDEICKEFSGHRGLLVELVGLAIMRYCRQKKIDFDALYSGKQFLNDVDFVSIRELFLVIRGPPL